MAVNYTEPRYFICAKNLIPKCELWKKNKCGSCPFRVCITEAEKERICEEVAIMGHIEGYIEGRT